MKFCLDAVRSLLLFGSALLMAGINTTLVAVEVEDGLKQFLSGDYDGCIKAATKAIKDSNDEEEWHALLIQSLLATGRYPEASKAIKTALSDVPRSIRLRWLAREAFLANGQVHAATAAVEGIIPLIKSRPYEYRDGSSLVALGQTALLGGTDPKSVLDQIFALAKKTEPKLRDVYLASGNLALEKHDFELAAKKFEEGLKQLPDDPDLHCGMAKAYAPNRQSLMLASVDAALQRNSNHVDSLLLLAEHNIDAEEYPEAEKLLDHIKSVNPWHPDAWAYRAVLAHLQNQSGAEEEARNTALKFWDSNPRVDYLIGLKLSQKYRFAEGSEHQRLALGFDSDYLPAKAQLAQDLLRLGEETEGWKLANDVQKQDGYDVEAFNLVSLHETMGKFTTLTNEDFVLRMNSREARLYGQRVLELLTRARTNLCAKYGQKLKSPTIVEIFADQKDFAVRTFGMPGNPGYLGVCFGRVVTANSPAAQMGHTVNWEAVLWHEFCHVVTLQMTRNKMPRWLSEGISVFEEGQANRAWGQHMNPRYREMILGDELTPLSKLSAAFLAPPSELHLQFAYFESSLVVEFLVERFGMEKLKIVLHHLGEGTEINQAIEKQIAPLADLEPQFDAFAREKAQKLAPNLDWEKPQFMGQASRPPSGNSRSRRSRTQKSRRNTDPAMTNAVVLSGSAIVDEHSWDTWVKEHPTNFYALSHRAEELIREKNWSEAKPLLEKFVELCGEYVGADSPHALLASTLRGLGETNEERRVLAKLAERDDEAPDAYFRLIELGKGAQDWPAVALNANRFLAVNPLIAPPYRHLAEACEHMRSRERGAGSGEQGVGGIVTSEAIAAYNALLELDPPDPAQLHFRLGQLLRDQDLVASRRHTLQALEEAPRYRDALQLLLALQSPAASGTPAAPRTNSTPSKSIQLE